MKAYSTREVAELIGLDVARVRSLMKSGVVTPQRDSAGHAAFTFQDLVLLRTAKGLIDAKVPARRITKALQALASQLPTDRPLSAVRVQIDGDRVIVRDSASSWEPESKQTVLDFSIRELGRKVAPLARESVQRALRTASTADDLFHAALESEEIGATSEAENAYRNAIAADPSHVAAHINLGRLRHSGKALDEATESSDWKTELQELCHKLGHGAPTYEVVDTSGPDHARRYACVVKVDGRIVGRGTGTSKKAAEQHCAQAALEELR